MKKCVRGFCAALTASALLVSATPSVEAGLDWGNVLGSVIGAAINNGDKNGGNNGGNNGGILGGLSNQKHAVPNPNNNEKLFMLAIHKNDIGTVQAMLDSGVDVNGVYKVDQWGITGNITTAFGLALYDNNRDIMQLLLENGANVNGYYDFNNNYINYFVFAAKRDSYLDVGLLEYLHNWGADINGKAMYNGNALDALPLNYWNSHVECARYLLENGINPDNIPDDTMPIFLRSVAKEDYPMIDLLASYGANLNIRDKKGRSALDIALDQNNLQLYKYVQDVLARGQQPSKYKAAKAEQAAAASLMNAKKKEVVAYGKHISEAQKLSTKAMKNYVGKDTPVLSWPTQERVSASKKSLESVNAALKEINNNKTTLQNCTPEEQEKIFNYEQGVKDLLLKQKEYIDILILDRPLTDDEQSTVMGCISDVAEISHSNSEKLQAAYDTLKFKF